jgi:hypothetical protein
MPQQFCLQVNHKITRRTWLGIAASLIPAAAWGQSAKIDPEERDVRALARTAGLRGVTARSSPRYLVLGDAPVAFQAQALRICDGLANDYLEHFKDKDFAVSPPKQRLTVVALSGPKAFAAFLGLKHEEAVGGEYDPQSNRLVIFDNRARANAGDLVRKANTLSLIHEATHQLTFNTGLLDRSKDVPECVSEGLAMYAEVRGLDGKTHKIGDVNTDRLELLPGTDANASWFPMKKLFTDRNLLEAPDTFQQAYAQSWLLVHYLMTGDRTARFREYLATLRMRTDASKRLEDAQAAFGDLASLDEALKAYAKKLRAPTQ